VGTKSNVYFTKMPRRLPEIAGRVQAEATTITLLQKSRLSSTTDITRDGPLTVASMTTPKLTKHDDATN
jgi:hypothetical protein